MSRHPAISVVLPAYNEVANIVTTLQRTHAALRRLGIDDYEVIVVDDGSTDATAEVVRTVAGELGPTVLVSHAHNRGYGAALRTGFEAATREAIFLMDSDGQFDPADLRLLLPHYTPHSLVAGFRARRSDPWVRRANHRIFFALVRLLVRPPLRDVNCAFKLFPRSLGVGLRAEGAMISTELALRAQALGFAVVEVPVPHYPRRAGTPTGAHPRVVARAFVELWALRRQRGVDRSRPR